MVAVPWRCTAAGWTDGMGELCMYRGAKVVLEAKVTGVEQRLTAVDDVAVVVARTADQTTLSILGKVAAQAHAARGQLMPAYETSRPD